MNVVQDTCWSLGEASALAAKAARGAGMPWGLADEAGFAVSWLHTHNLPGIAALCRYLHWHDSGTFAKWPEKAGNNQFYCPIRIGTAFMDGALPASVSINAVREPLLLLPFIGKRAWPLQFKVYFDDLAIHVSQNGIDTLYEPLDLLVTSANCAIQKSDKNAPELVTSSKKNRVLSCHFGCVQTLQKFAKKTYAPATEKSRLLGAGAALNDND